MNEFLYNLILGSKLQTKASGQPSTPEYHFEYESEEDEEYEP